MSSPFEPPNPEMPQRPQRPGQPPNEPPAQAPPAQSPPYQQPQPPQQPPPYQPPPYQPPTQQQPAVQPPPFQAPPQQAFQAPAVQPPDSPNNTGGSNTKALLIGACALVAALIIGLGAYIGLSGDDDPEVTASTTVPVGDTTTVPEQGTTTVPSETTAPVVDVSTDTLAQSVVQIFTVSGDQPLCSGSGTILTSDGLILTNAHVVENAGPCAYDRLVVAITDSADVAPEITYEAEVYGYDPALDLAVIGISADLDGNPITVTDLPTAVVGDSDAVGLGDQIRILGYPGIGGDTITFTSGSVSGFTSEAGISQRAWIKTDATISGGNSGGLAINDAFEIIGVPTQASASADGQIADCRVVTDTNGDGLVDSNDSCIPIGGFINGIRPVNLANELLAAAEARIPVVQGGAPDPTLPVGDARFYGILMTSSIENDIAGPLVNHLPSATPEVCAIFSYEGMTDGLVWDALWSIDGEFVEDISIVESEWIGGESGDDWWVCATGDTGGLPDGIYELQLYIQGDFSSSNTIPIGDSLTPVPVQFVNDTAAEICYVRVSPNTANGWGPDELASDQTLLAGSSVTINVPPGSYDVLGQDCDFETLVEWYEIDFAALGVFNLSGN